MLDYMRKYLRRKADPIDLLLKLTTQDVQLQRIVHVGAHLAQERFHYESCGFHNVLWVEGSPEVHRRLDAVLENHAGQTQHQTRCALLTDTNGDKMDLKTFTNDGMSSSIFSPTETSLARWPHVKETGTVESVCSCTVDTLLTGTEYFCRTDVLVVDVQGAELLVLKGALETLKHAKAVVAEVSTVPYYEGGALFPEVNSFLEHHGFTAMSTPRRHGDMLFLKNRLLKAAA